MYRLLVLSVAVAAAVAGPLKDGAPADECVSWDDNIDKTVFQFIRNQLNKTDSETIKIKDRDFSAFGFGLKFKDAQIGNLSSLKLNPQSSSDSSSLCTYNNTKVLSANLGFGDLSLRFGEFLLFAPLLEIGGAETSISLEGINLFVAVNTTTDPTSKNCAVTLERFDFNEWGALELDMSGGIINFIFSKFFNYFFGERIVGLLKTEFEAFGVESKIRNAVNNVLAKDSDAVCAILNNKLY